ncbi:hypothetical protein [Massilia sp. Leaf139]|uniref:hypothetical protein n=1 Tax=Massilia sp. Leaf139 TaxID=1736272 RepID=UPI0012E7854F|nr:hypothetical protein [Massilia sp. Leaf139]
MPSRLPAARAALGARAVCLGVAVLAALPAGASAQPVSAAETLLFETDHLALMKVPATLVYEFRKQSNVEPAFTDKVELDVSRDKGQVHAVLRFLSGERRRALPEADDAHGNPVLLGFLEHDIAEMKRLTGGSVTYFRKRIRMALADGAQVTPQRITWQGKTIEAQAIRIQPYLDDPLHARFEKYVRKTYTFVLSDGVPGGIYQVSTSLANAGQPAPGTVVARTAAPGTPASAAAKPGAAKPGAPVPGIAPGTAPGNAPGAATAGTATSGASASGKAVPGAAVSAAAPDKAQPGATIPEARPTIDETLTLVKVAVPRR